MIAVVLLSGGLDSATTLALAKKENRAVHTLSFDYHQRHRRELDCAAKLAEKYESVSHVIKIDGLEIIGGSALTDLEIPVPKDGVKLGVPITYVPARNTVFLSYALGFAETVGAEEIWLGVNALDYSGYPDCRPEYIEAYQRLADIAAPGKSVRLRTPLISLTKKQIIQLGLDNGLDYSLTSSCYDPAPEGACGLCDSCRLRLRGFSEAGISDPITYQ